MDLKWIITKPVVIRTDILSRKEVLLPRTETIFTYNDATNFIRRTTENLIEQGLQLGEFCYLIHEFITSKAGGSAFTKPHFNRVKLIPPGELWKDYTSILTIHLKLPTTEKIFIKRSDASTTILMLI